MQSCSSFLPPNTTALLSSTAVKVKYAHGGGVSPVVAGQLHTPAVEIEETVKEHQCCLHVVQNGYNVFMLPSERL